MRAFRMNILLGVGEFDISGTASRDSTICHTAMGNKLTVPGVFTYMALSGAPWR
jgi:hypothetical protein